METGSGMSSITVINPDSTVTSGSKSNTYTFNAVTPFSVFDYGTRPVNTAFIPMVFL